MTAAPGSAVGSFAPNLALGAGIDRLPRDATDTLYSAPSLERVLSAGWGAVTYRSNTELHVEAWHWNPRGTWSDPSGRGYFTGIAQPSEMIRHSLGYPLPRRGFTHNEGTEAHGFSRMTDGDASSFWKSNPYLDRRFTLEDDADHPQWVVVDLGKHTPIDTLRIDWGAPYARRYRVQYWTGEDAIKKPSQGQWRDCPVRGESGEVTQGAGGTTTTRLAPSPIDVRFIRILLEESSETCEGGKAHDPRDCVGYAIRELYLGTLGAGGELVDVTHHSPDQSQTATDCSSVDPWHEPANARDQEGDQSGLDLFFTSGVTRGLPAMIPVAVLYGTPEDSAAEIQYVETRGYPISYVEMGEESDGQYMTPEHYAALYLQWAAALHRVDPKLKLGGPAFASSNEDIKAWPDARGNASWLGRFLDYLKAHGRLSDLAFMSFEHYPYEPCKYTWDGLYDEPHLIRHIMQAWKGRRPPARGPDVRHGSEPRLARQWSVHGHVRRALARRLCGGVSYCGRRGDVLLPLPARAHLARVRRHRRRLHDVHDRQELPDSAAHVAVLRQSAREPGVGPTGRRHSFRVSGGERSEGRERAAHRDGVRGPPAR